MSVVVGVCATVVGDVGVAVYVIVVVVGCVVDDVVGVIDVGVV